MAGVYCEAFENYTSKAEMLEGNQWAQVDDKWGLSTANPRTGTQHLRLTAGTNGVKVARRNFRGAKATVGVGFGVYMEALPAGEGSITMNLGVMLRDAANGEQIAIVFGTDGGVVARRGLILEPPNPGTLLGRSAPCVRPGVYNQIEFRATAGDGGAGAIEIRVNGVTVLNLTGIDTTHTANTEFSQMAFARAASVSAFQADIDDLHVWDLAAGEGPTDFVGNAAVVRRPLAADTAEADMMVAGGITATAVLSDRNDATYLSAGAAGQRTAVAASALPDNVTAVVYQQVNFRARKTGSGDASVTAGIGGGAAETQVAQAPLTLINGWYDGIVAVNPDTAAPWAPSDTAVLSLERTL